MNRRYQYGDRSGFMPPTPASATTQRSRTTSSATLRDSNDESDPPMTEQEQLAGILLSMQNDSWPAGEPHPMGPAPMSPLELIQPVQQAPQMGQVLMLPTDEPARQLPQGPVRTAAVLREHFEDYFTDRVGNIWCGRCIFRDYEDNAMCRYCRQNSLTMPNSSANLQPQDLDVHPEIRSESQAVRQAPEMAQFAESVRRGMEWSAKWWDTYNAKRASNKAVDAQQKVPVPASSAGMGLPPIDPSIQGLAQHVSLIPSSDMRSTTDLSSPTTISPSSSVTGDLNLLPLPTATSSDNGERAPRHSRAYDDDFNAVSPRSRPQPLRVKRPRPKSDQVGRSLLPAPRADSRGRVMSIEETIAMMDSIEHSLGFVDAAMDVISSGRVRSEKVLFAMMDSIERNLGCVDAALQAISLFSAATAPDQAANGPSSAPVHTTNDESDESRTESIGSTSTESGIPSGVPSQPQSHQTVNQSARSTDDMPPPPRPARRRAHDPRICPHGANCSLCVAHERRRNGERANEIPAHLVGAVAVMFPWAQQQAERLGGALNDRAEWESLCRRDEEYSDWLVTRPDLARL